MALSSVSSSLASYVLLLVCVVLFRAAVVDGGRYDLDPEVPYKRDKVSGTLEIRADLENATDFDLYIFYAPRVDKNRTNCEGDHYECKRHQCMSNEPAYAIIFQLDREAEVTTMCREGAILCLHGRPRVDIRDEDYGVRRKEWTKECGDLTRYPRAIKVSANISHWTIETGHELINRVTNKTLAGEVNVRKSADGVYFMANKMINKIEYLGAVDFGEFDRFYKKYLYDSIPECVSKADGMIKPHHIRLVGSPKCQMLITFYGHTRPYSVAGTSCELQWEELYACNNGGGLDTTRKCTFTVETGLTEAGSTQNSTSAQQEDTQSDEDAETISKTTELDEQSTHSVNAGVTFSASATIPLAQGLVGTASGQTSIQGSKSWGKSKSTSDAASNEYRNALRKSSQLSEDVVQMAEKSTFDHTTITYKIETPRGWYQSLMTLKMTCAGIDLYPGFVDVQSRRAGSYRKIHHYSTPGAAQNKNLTDDAIAAENELRQVGLDAPNDDQLVEEVEDPVMFYDRRIVGDLTDLTSELLGWWDSSHTGNFDDDPQDPYFGFDNITETDNSTILVQ